MQSCMDDLVVWGVDVMGNVEKISGESGETIRLTYRIRIVIAAQSQRDLEVWTNAPLVLSVKAQTIDCYRLCRADREVLGVTDSLSVVETRQVLPLAVADGANAR